MESFALWQARVAEDGERSDGGVTLFLAYKPVSAAQATAAGLELIGTSWDAHGVQVKAFKSPPPGAPVYACTVCGGNSKLYQGMYCCGRKRVTSK